MTYINPHKLSEILWRCDCGREFQKSSSLCSHARFCSEYKKINKSSTYLKDNLYVCECGKSYENYQSFNAHLSHCDIHHKVLGTERKLRPSELYHTRNWENKTEEQIKEIYDKAGKTYSERIQKGEVIPSFLGKTHSKESRQKQRESTIRYIQNLKNTSNIARYNPKQIAYIEGLNRKYGWNLQHAENGGEFSIIGYFLDGYDKELNIVFEYDEKRHYKDWKCNILTDKDVQRQANIINELHCRFFRYNEKLDLFYEVK